VRKNNKTNCIAISTHQRRSVYYAPTITVISKSGRRQQMSVWTLSIVFCPKLRQADSPLKTEQQPRLNCVVKYRASVPYQRLCPNDVDRQEVHAIQTGSKNRAQVLHAPRGTFRDGIILLRSLGATCIITIINTHCMRTHRKKQYCRFRTSKSAGWGLPCFPTSS
jgi:hypothetical protein